MSDTPWTKAEMSAALIRLANMPIAREGTLAGDRDAKAVDLACDAIRALLAEIKGKKPHDH